MPSLFSVSSPATAFQWWYVVFMYVLPLMLYACWASLSFMDLDECGAPAGGRMLWSVLLVFVPIVGGAVYLLTVARAMRASSRLAIVLAGLIIWLIPLGVGLWLAGGPLGPKALS